MGSNPLELDSSKKFELFRSDYHMLARYNLIFDIVNYILRKISSSGQRDPSLYI